MDLFTSVSNVSDSDCVSRSTSSSRKETSGCGRVISCTSARNTFPERGTPPKVFESSFHQGVWFLDRLDSGHWVFFGFDVAVLCDLLNSQRWRRNVSDPLGFSADCNAADTSIRTSSTVCPILMCSLTSTPRSLRIETAPSPPDVPSDPRRQTRIQPNSKNSPLAWCRLNVACGKQTLTALRQLAGSESVNTTI